MKRMLFPLLLLIFFSCVLFAEVRPINNSMDIWGYYKSGGSTLLLVVNDTSNKRLYETETVAGSEHLGEEGATIFTWTLSGTGTNVTLKFTFSELQAIMRQIYYRPAYSIQISRSTPSGTPGLQTYTKTSQDHAFTSTFSKSFTGNVTEANSWTGDCVLNITDYSSDGLPAEENAYVFRCRVSVEVSTP